MVYRGQLIVATTNGVYGKSKQAKRKAKFRLLGRRLPAAPVFSLEPWPGHPKQILAASLGRGVYSFKFRH